MSESIQILIAKFPLTDQAERALAKIRTAKENQGVEIFDAAVVWRTDDGKLHIHETVDVTGARGATVGGILGGVLGMIAGPAGIVAGAALGAAVGGTAASFFDAGIPHERLEKIGTELEAHQAALVVLTEAGYVEFLETLVKDQGVELLSEEMNAVAAQQMAHEHDIAIKSLKMGDALATGGMASPTDNA